VSAPKDRQKFWGYTRGKSAFEIYDREFARILPKPKIDGLILKHASSEQILNTVSSIIKDQAVYSLNQT
jgi:hypothetical protein